jgi:hypothetical protein
VISRSVTLSCALNLLCSSMCFAAPPSQLYGKSVVVAWNENRIQRDIGTEQQPHPVLNSVEYIVYVSTVGRTFERQRRAASSGGRAGGSSNQERAPGDAYTPNVRSGQLSFQGNKMIQILTYESGARRVVVDFDSGFGSCTAEIIQGKENGRPRIGTSSVTGRRVEILSIQIASPRCSIREGNAVAQ